MARLLFFYFAAMIVGSGLAVVSFRNILYSALALLVTLVHVAGLYILLNAEFIAAVQVIVYAGAILVLYLFVLMMFHVKGEDRQVHRHYPVGIFLGLVMLGQLALALSSFRPGRAGEETVQRIAQIGNTEVIGQALLTQYLFPFEVASLILLVAMVGAIVLAKR